MIMKDKFKALILNNQAELAITLMFGQKWNIKQMVNFITECIDLNNIWRRVESEGEIMNSQSRGRGYATLEDKLLSFRIISNYVFIVYQYNAGNSYRLVYDNKIINDEDFNYGILTFKSTVKQRVKSQLERDINAKFRELIIENYDK